MNDATESTVIGPRGVDLRVVARSKTADDERGAGGMSVPVHRAGLETIADLVIAARALLNCQGLVLRFTDGDGVVLELGAGDGIKLGSVVDDEFRSVLENKKVRSNWQEYVQDPDVVANQGQGGSGNKYFLSLPVIKESDCTAILIAVDNQPSEISDGLGRVLLKFSRMIRDELVRLFSLQVESDRSEEFRTSAKSMDREHLLKVMIDSFSGPAAYSDTNYRCLIANTAFSDWFGLPPSEAEGRSLSEILPATVLENPVDFGSLWRGNRIKEIRQIESGQHGVRHLLVVYIPDVFQGQTRGVVSIGTDVTDLIKTERDLERRTEQAESAARTKGQFLANMSHEIRTPMNAIIGMTDLALETKLSADQRGLLEIVKDAGQSLLSLINDILDFSKLEAGKIAIESVPFDLHDCIRRSTGLLSQKATDKEISLDWVIEDSVPRVIVGDGHRMRQVLLNLVSNAVKFTEKGWVLVNVSATSDANTEDQHVLTVTIKDTGIGIGPEAIDEIFKPFSQADGSTTRRFGGTGLGVTICKELIVQMGGELSVRSAAGQGSEFYFSIPVQEAELPSAPDLKAQYELVVADRSPLPDKRLANALAEIGVGARSVRTPEELNSALAKCRGNVCLLVKASWLPLVSADFWDNLSALVPIERRVLLVDRKDVDSLKMPDVSWELKWPDSSEALLEVLPKMLSFEGQGSSDAGQNASRHILVADDNAINRMLVIRLLESMGHQVQIAENGLDAVNLSQGYDFDLILMDVQMPVMGGFEATAQIRKREADSDKRTPIVAMTAHASAEDHERSLEAGMDGHMTKPISRRELVDGVRQFALAGSSRQPISPAPAPVPATATPDSPSSPPSEESDSACETEMLNLDLALNQLQGDSELLGEIIDLFVANLPDTILSLQGAAASDEWEQVGRIAHSIKGDAGTLGSLRAKESAAALENACRLQSGSVHQSSVEILVSTLKTLRELLLATKK